MIVGVDWWEVRGWTFIFFSGASAPASPLLLIAAWQPTEEALYSSGVRAPCTDGGIAYHFGQRTGMGIVYLFPNI